MASDMTRRSFVGSLAVLPFAAEAALSAQGGAAAEARAAEAARLRAAAASPFPVIDTHIHIFDKSIGMPYPSDMPGGGEPPQGHIALPNRYKLVSSPFGIVGAVIVEASARLEDNFWWLQVAKDNPIIVGVVGNVEPMTPDFRKNIDKLVENKLFFGIRQGSMEAGLDKPDYMANLKHLADADCNLDVNTPALKIQGTEVLVKTLDKVPSLRLVMDHLPEVPYAPRVAEFREAAARKRYTDYLRELGKRPNVYIKLSEVVHRYESGKPSANGKVSTDLNMYKEWLDELWSIFGEDRIMFGSDWPQSEGVEYNSYPNVISTARAYVMSKNPAAMEKVFWKNSTKPYRWVSRTPEQKRG